MSSSDPAQVYCTKPVVPQMVPISSDFAYSSASSWKRSGMTGYGTAGKNTLPPPTPAPARACARTSRIWYQGSSCLHLGLRRRSSSSAGGQFEGLVYSQHFRMKGNFQPYSPRGHGAARPHPPLLPLQIPAPATARETGRPPPRWRRRTAVPGGRGYGGPRPHHRSRPEIPPPTPAVPPCQANNICLDMVDCRTSCTFASPHLRRRLNPETPPPGALPCHWTWTTGR